MGHTTMIKEALPVQFILDENVSETNRKKYSSIISVKANEMKHIQGRRNYNRFDRKCPVFFITDPGI